MELQAQQGREYEYLDAGRECRLERFGDFILDRPSPPAIWNRERPELWQRADGCFHRNSSGGGDWTFRRKMPANWTVRWDDRFRFHVKPTGFGHIGLFPEHTCHWDWVRERIRQSRSASACRVLNLFAYTGALTLVSAAAGAEVCHLDAVPDINDWARRNAEASGLADAPVRWITDDATKFAAREARRGRQYEGIILDPPSYGKGPKGERWIIEQHLIPLMDILLTLTSNRPSFVLFTCHTLGFSAPLMKNLLFPWQAKFGGGIECGTMVLKAAAGRCVLPAGFFARWTPEIP